MSGKDREEVLSQLFEVLALDESGAAAEAEARR